MDKKRIKSALISVWDKEGLMPLLEMMRSLNITIYSTGGTYEYIRKSGFVAESVEELTGYPSVFGGRVKTLHPTVMGGILFRRDNPDDVEECSRYSVQGIDLVVVDLYPFREAVESGKTGDEIIETIDIGGISLIRAAAKNFRDVVVIPEKGSYPALQAILENEAITDESTRRQLACKAFDVSSEYDSFIYRYFSEGMEGPSLKISSREMVHLRYGENPHQKGCFYGDLSKKIRQFHGKAISYNNLLDIDAALKIIDEFDEPTVAILKHNNACGLASRDVLEEAWKAAFEADTQSAFGGIIILNRAVNKAVAEKISEIFFEVIIAPEYDTDAFGMLSQKKNRIILESRSSGGYTQPVRNVLNGYLVQDFDKPGTLYDQMKTVTTRCPDEREMSDLLFANKIVKHTKSNAIVLVKDKQLIGSGTGQTSRIDAMKQAVAKARHFNLPLSGAVIASDAYFPFADNVEVAWEAGIRSVIQPGGSIRDKDSIDFCNKHDMAMVFTGIRHFKH